MKIWVVVCEYGGETWIHGGYPAEQAANAAVSRLEKNFREEGAVTSHRVVIRKQRKREPR